MTDPPAITACLLARNEEARIEPALQSLQGWTAQILLLDHGSEDRTAEIARSYGAEVIPVSRTEYQGKAFDAARNLAVPTARGEWLFYLDADERVPERLGPVLLQLVREQGEQFEALVLPFKHYFCGKWMEHSGWWPGYTRPQLLKKGRFRYNSRLHSGVDVDGRTTFFPADDPDLAIIHHSYADLRQYLEKLNRYTDGEAESLLADGKGHTWQAQLAHFVHDWQQYYERGRGDQDGMHGFVLAFMSAFYRFAARAKAWDLRRQQGELSAVESVPAHLREMLEFMAEVAQRGPEPWLSQRHFPSPKVLPLGQPAASPAIYPLVWHGPLLDPSGYADEGRQFVLGLLDAGEDLQLLPDRWGEAEAGIDAELRSRLETAQITGPWQAELLVRHTLPPLAEPSPRAQCNIARTMFETDRLPAGWPERLNRLDRIWVPSEFNRETFVRSGVQPDKLAVVPGALDVERFAAEVEPWPLPDPRPSGIPAFGPTENERLAETRCISVPPSALPLPHADHLPHPRPSLTHAPYRFLSVFDWTRHKGWDVLLPAFAEEFREELAQGEVELWLKVWSSNFYTADGLREQADTVLRERLSQGLAEFPGIHLWTETIPYAELPRLYRAVDAFVLPTRGEGWCRPLMEAMAAGLPTIATAWSALTTFHDAEVGFPVRYRLEPVSAEGAREIPTYAGHCWAEPDATDLRLQLRRVFAEREEARTRGEAAQQRIRERYSRTAVTRLVQEELAHCRELARTQRKARPRSASGTASPSRSLHPANSPARPPLPVSPGLRGESLPQPFVPKANPLNRETAVPVDFRALLGRPLRVRWEGDQALLSSLARVNREFCLALLAGEDVELSLGERRLPWHTLTEADDPRFGPLFALRGASLSGPPDVTVRHFFPPDWSRPAAGKLVVIQPWEYGHLPREWVTGAREQADEVWAYSRWVREIYARSGVPAEKVQVVPLGFDPQVFTPDGPCYRLPTEKRTRFLFVGGAIDRKGADLLLQAYLRAFTPADDVCLVVKDMGTHTFYRGATFADAFRQAAADPRAPEILYLDDDLAEAELAGLYRSCTCVVAPYRGEGFALAPLEGMACGLPTIVTAGGPTDDYAADETALRLPRVRRPAGRDQVGDAFSCVGDVWQLEPDLGGLVGALRWVHTHPEGAAEKGQAARAAVADAWTWEQAGGIVRARLRELVCPTVATDFVPARPWTPGPATEDVPHGQHTRPAETPVTPVAACGAEAEPLQEVG